VGRRRNDKIVAKRVERKDRKLDVLKRQAKARAERLGDKADPDYKIRQ
jgi:hypothetical protein